MVRLTCTRQSKVDADEDVGVRVVVGHFRQICGCGTLLHEEFSLVRSGLSVCRAVVLYVHHDITSHMSLGHVEA